MNNLRIVRILNSLRILGILGCLRGFLGFFLGFRHGPKTSLSVPVKKEKYSTILPPPLPSILERLPFITKMLYSPLGKTWPFSVTTPHKRKGGLIFSEPPSAFIGQD